MQRMCLLFVEICLLTLDCLYVIFFNLKIMFVLKYYLFGLGFVLLLYVLRKVTICNVPLTQEKWSIATVRPILRETLPKSVRLPSVVATMTKTRQNVRINSMPTPCTRV